MEFGALIANLELVAGFMMTAEKSVRHFYVGG
jgi:hypothetical protein